MKSEYRTTLFCGVMFFGVPALYGLGDRLGGTRLAIALAAGAALASFLYMRSGDREAARGTSAEPAARLRADATPPAGVPPAGGR